MPELNAAGNDPYGFMSLADVVEYFDTYNRALSLTRALRSRSVIVEKAATDLSYVTSEKSY